MTNDEIRPFRIDIPQADLDELYSRVSRARWPHEIPGVGWERGVPLGYMRQLADYWGHGYDWRKHEARLNEIPQFTTTIDGLSIHFLHIRSPEPDALPLILSHSWPGSIVELSELVGPLTNPRAHGGDAADAFHLVVPSIPGFGFTAPVEQAGWDLVRTARAWVELMRRLGYERYGAGGGDVGAGLSGELPGVDPEGVVGVHVTTDPKSIVAVSIFSGADLSSAPGFTEAEQARLALLQAEVSDGMGYIQIQSTRPQTLGYLLADSPVGQLAWIVEKFKAWTDPAAELPEDAVDRDLLLTNVSLYSLTGTGASAAQFIYENMHAERDWGAESSAPAPTGFALFAADDLSRRLMDPENKIEHWSEFERGGHFPALEVPDLLAGDLRKFFRQFR